MLPTRDPRITALLKDTDYFRRSPSRFGGRGEHKEWQHFVIHTGQTHLLVNFSLLDEPQPGAAAPAEVARLIVLAHGESGWHGDVERFDPHDVEVHAGRLEARFGQNTLRFEGGAWRLSFALREHSVAGELELVPVAPPAFSAHHLLAPQRPISWLFLPRLEVHGSLTLAGKTVPVDRGLAYHDHNWGHFRWGDDFCWEWGSVLPRHASDPWSAVLVRMSDRSRTVARYQALFAWYGGEALRIFRDEELRFSSPLGFRAGGTFSLPRALALLAPGSAADLPQRLEVHAHGGGDELHLSLEPHHVARLLLPIEEELEKLATIHEVLGDVGLRGQVRGKQVDTEGTGVFEFVRG